MSTMQLFSEPYRATGGLAAEGVINQLGRPDIEPLEVLVREAVQNCWDAKSPSAPGITVEIGKLTLSPQQLEFCRSEILVSPPPGLALGDELRGELQLLYFADFGTEGLGGPTRADELGRNRDFVDFVRNIGQPPDKDLGGGSFGYGKAAFYIASRARTILIDTLCRNAVGEPERRLIGCALGDNFDAGGRPYTGRHWWGRIEGEVPEPLVGAEAENAARGLGLPDRSEGVFGTTVAVTAPRFTIEGDDGTDDSMTFIAEALAWNFWPRMIETRGADPPDDDVPRDRRGKSAAHPRSADAPATARLRRSDGPVTRGAQPRDRFPARSTGLGAAASKAPWTRGCRERSGERDTAARSPRPARGTADG